MSSEFTFVVEKNCPVCGKSVKVVKVKSRLAAIGVDNDYCCHYRDFNPYLYHIWVCDGCGFAADEKVFLTALSPVRRELIGNALMEHHVHFEFNEERSVPDGIASLKLAIFCAEVLKAPLARQAGLAMRLAWVYRIDGQTEKEREASEQALNLYIRSLETEHYPIENLTDTMVTYLIGALYAELGDRKRRCFISAILWEIKTIQLRMPSWPRMLEGFGRQYESRIRRSQLRKMPLRSKIIILW